MAGDRHRRARADLRADRAAARRSPRSCGALDRAGAASRPTHTRLVYVSPLKALAYDVERNLRAPLRGIGADLSRRASAPATRRSASARRCAATPPDILITTPESLYLMLTSQAREILRGVEAVIVDEIHAVAAHQARRAPRADARAPGRAQRRTTRSASACSATQNPLEEVGRFLVGPRRTCADRRRRASASRSTSRSTCRSSRWSSPSSRADARPARPDGRRRGDAHARSGRRSTPSCSSSSASTARRSSSSTTAAAPSGSRCASTSCAEEEIAARPPRLARARGAHASSRRCSRPASCRAWSRPRRSSWASTWARSTSCCRSSRRSRSPAACSASAAPGTASATSRKGRIFPKFRADLLECAVVVKLMREGAIEPTVVPRNALDVLAQQIVAIAAAPSRSRSPSTSSTRSSRARTPTPSCRATLLENVLDMLDGRYPSQEFGELRPRIVWDRVAGTIRARKGARQLAVTNAGTIPDRGLFSRRRCPTAAASASSTRRWSTRRAPARRSCSAPRRGGSRRSGATA